MPTNRRPLARRRNPTFTPEILSLFVELENGSKRGEQFRVQEQDLMYQLGLVEQFWTMNSVLDRSSVPYTSPEYVAWRHWHECRAIRLQLLAAIASAGADAPTARAH